MLRDLSLALKGLAVAAIPLWALGAVACRDRSGALTAITVLAVVMLIGGWFGSSWIDYELTWRFDDDD